MNSIVAEDEIPPIPTKFLPKSKWDDEDVDDTDIKDSWEDEDEPPQPQQPVAKAPEEKAPKKPAAKATEKKGKAVEVSKQQPLDPVAEKLHQQRYLVCLASRVMALRIFLGYLKWVLLHLQLLELSSSKMRTNTL
ncbi:hypothetical protein V6N13_091386 [Hibiscus sabdariffa]|uniref:Eukaryotic translation initiation factor 3 30 kDa subunit n=1 Tax=Hibiscus sabdariffa TaxID=183260 RepID=A0ABR2QDN6_9ROSI